MRYASAMDSAAAIPDRFSVWYYLRTGKGEFSGIAQRRFWDFTSNRTPLPGAVSSPALTATFMIVRRGRQVLHLWHARFDRYELTSDGRVDPAFSADERRDYEMMCTALEPFNGHRPANPPASVRLVDRRLDTLYRWQPIEADWQALEQILNRRAGFPLVGSGHLHI